MCRCCVQSAFEVSLGFPTPAELLREVLALAHEPNDATESAVTVEGSASSGSPVAAEPYSYGGSIAALPDDEDEEAQGLGGFSALESVGGVLE